MSYIDMFVLPVPKARLEDYKAVARESAALWKEYGAIGYIEAVGDDIPYGELTSFPRSVQASDDETVIVSWLVYPSKAVRDAASKQMMQDPRASKVMEAMPTDGKRMIFGGFETFLEQ